MRILELAAFCFDWTGCVGWDQEETLPPLTNSISPSITKYSIFQELSMAIAIRLEAIASRLVAIAITVGWRPLL